MPSTLFGLIKRTTKEHPGRVVSAYKDNCAFLQGPAVEQFSPAAHETVGLLPNRGVRERDLGQGRDAQLPDDRSSRSTAAATGTAARYATASPAAMERSRVAGTAVYMTAYPRLDGGREWEKATEPREWLYQTPEDHPDQGVERGFRFRKQVRAAVDYRLRTDFRASGEW